MNSSKRVTVGVAVVSLLLPAVATVGLFDSVAGAAGTGYGGVTTVAGPGGVSLPIIRVFALSANAALRGQATVDGCTVIVNVPRGTFPSGDQLIIANASRIPPPVGTTTVVSFFIGAYRYGAKVTGTFRHSITAVVLGSKIKVVDQVWASTGGGWNLVRSASVTNGRATIAITSDPTIDVARRGIGKATPSSIVPTPAKVTG